MTTPAPLYLHGGSLLSKWGFSDGDILIDWAWDNLPDQDAETVTGQHHDLLIELVKQHLVPKLSEWDVELEEIETIHNPIRARRVDGDEVNQYDRWPHPIENVEVEIPADEVLRKARA